MNGFRDKVGTNWTDGWCVQERSSAWVMEETYSGRSID